MSPIIVTTVVLVVLLVGFYLFVQRRSKLSSIGAVKLAESYGIEVEKVTRLLPVTEGAHLSDRLKEEECYSYAVQSRSRSQTNWKLLQRFGEEHKDADYWVLESNNDLSSELNDAIGMFKASFEEEYFEIESRNERIYIYCEEKRNPEVISQISQWLQNLAVISS